MLANGSQETPRSGKKQQQGLYSNSIHDFSPPISLKKKLGDLEEKM
jgi:hypothetical protein